MTHSILKPTLRRSGCLAALFILLIFYACTENSPNESGSITASPAELKFGTVLTSTTKSLDLLISNTKQSDFTANLTITGTGKDNFSLLKNQVVVPKGGSATIKVSFTPTGDKQYTASLQIGSEAVVVLTGTGSSNLTIEVNPDSLFFGMVKPTVEKVLPVNIKNVSNSDLTLNLSLSGADAANFSIVDSVKVSIPKDSTLVILIKFLGTEERNYNALLVLGSYRNIPLTSRVSSSAGLNLSATNLNFGYVAAGKTSFKKLFIENQTGQPVQLQLSIYGNDASFFKIENYPNPLIPTGFKDSLNISFTPTADRSYNAILTLDAAKSITVTLDGYCGANNELEITPKSLDFGSTTPGNSVEKTIDVKNISQTPVKFNLSLSGSAAEAFTFDIKNTITLNPGSSQKIAIIFKPLKAKVFSEKLFITTINSNVYEVPIQATCADQVAQILNSAKTSTSPGIDGSIDAVWSNAEELPLTLTQLQNMSGDFRTFNAKLKSLHDNEYIYFLVIIGDNTPNDEPNRIIFNGGDPADDKNWSITTQGQDGISFVFPITATVKGFGKSFVQYGCSTACHTAAYITNYESGMYPDEGAIDIWYWKAGTTNPQGYSDDYFASGEIGMRKGDIIGTSFAYENFRGKTIGTNFPISIAGGDNNSLDKKKYLWDLTSESFDASLPNPASGLPWQKNDGVPGWKLRVPVNEFDEGYRGDIQARGKYDNGFWVVEFKRKLNTLSSNNDDVVFDTGSVIPFSFAYFDNSRQYASFEYINLPSNPKPGHFGPKDNVITLKFK